MPDAPGRVNGWAIEFARPDLARPLDLAGLQGLRSLGIERNAMLSEFLLDAQVAMARSADMDARFGKALLRQVVVGFQPVEHFGDPGHRVADVVARHVLARHGQGPRVRQQLALHLRTTVLALREPLQRARLQRARRGRFHSEASAPGSSGMPTASRTLFSISWAISGFSFRNSRALSLPWPIFSPL